MATPDTQASSDLTTLFQAHANGLGGAVRAILGGAEDVEEVLQEAFLKLWRNRRRFEAAKDPVAWVFVVTLNCARDLRRRHLRRRPTAQLDEEFRLPPCPRQEKPSDSLEFEERVDAARGAIHRLGEREREVFLLRTSADLSFCAIANALAIPEGTAKTRMRRALLQLRRHLAAPHPSPEARNL